MKKIFFLLSAALFIFVFTSGNTLADVIHVTLTWENGQLVRTPPGPYHKSAGDTFEVTNNTDFAIWVQLYDAEDHMHGNMVVAPGETDALPLQCIERWVCYQYPVAGGGAKDLVCDQLIPIDQDWPNHKMHYPQRPDPNGWDVMATGNVSLPNATMLADDFQCSETGYIEDIHFWGSWKDDIEGNVVMFHLAIHENIDPGPHGYSEPGAELWFVELYEPEFTVTPVTPPGDQGWYDPITGDILPHNHQFYYRYDVILPEGSGYWQTEGEIYWLRIVAFVDDPAGTAWGWKTSIDPLFMDDAVYDSYIEPMGWRELYEPIVIPDPITNTAGITIDMNGLLFDQYTDPDAYGGTWYFYENTEWWNVWFYDHPFDPTRLKHLWMNGYVMPFEPGPAWVEIAFNWSTPFWPPGQPPPIPPLSPPEEEEFIWRETIFAGEVFEEFPIEAFFEILEYNPEWVSIDIRGYNVRFEGELTHQCLPRDPQEESLDLAFVITGGEEEEPVYDLWETPEGHNTYVDFACPTIDPIPSDFFGPGSDPFDGRIDFRGDPLTTTGDLGPTDTIVKRSRPADLPDCPDTDGPIETQMVALDLVSTAPITVTYFGGQDPEDWDVRVCLSESVPQPFGTTTFIRNCQEGGTFTAHVPVIPVFIFTRISDGTEYAFDFGEAGQSIEYEVLDSHWQFIDSFFDVYVSPPEGVLVSNCDDEPDISIGPSAVDLIPGLQADPCENCENPPMDHLIPITSLIDPTGLACAQQDIWPPHDVDEDIPTLTEWGMIILGLLLLTAGTIAVVRKRKAAMAGTN